MRQVEVATTIVFTAPRHASMFFEALAADNLDLGRPDNMEIIFNRQIRSTCRGVFRTAIDRDDGVVVNAFYRHSRIKYYLYYLKDHRALRVETVINDAYDIGVLRRIEHFDELVTKARDANHRLLDTIRVGQGCVLAHPAIGSRTPPSPQRGGGLQPSDSATLGSWPWPARCACHCSPSPASPTRACAPVSPGYSASPTTPAR